MFIIFFILELCYSFVMANFTSPGFRLQRGIFVVTVAFVDTNNFANYCSYCRIYYNHLDTINSAIYVIYYLMTQYLVNTVTFTILFYYSQVKNIIRYYKIY